MLGEMKRVCLKGDNITNFQELRNRYNLTSQEYHIHALAMYVLNERRLLKLVHNP